MQRYEPTIMNACFEHFGAAALALEAGGRPQLPAALFKVGSLQVDLEAAAAPWQVLFTTLTADSSGARIRLAAAEQLITVLVRKMRARAR